MANDKAGTAFEVFGRPHADRKTDRMRISCQSHELTGHRLSVENGARAGGRGHWAGLSMVAEVAKPLRIPSSTVGGTPRVKNIVAFSLIITSALLATVFPMQSAMAQSPKSYWVFDERSSSLSAVQRDPDTVQAKEWAAFYFRRGAPAGTMSQRWGIDTGDSAADVLRKVKESQRFERQFEKWCQCSWGENTSFNVIAPVVTLSGGWIVGPGPEDIETHDQQTKETGRKLHAMVDRLLKYRDIFNQAAAMAGEAKLPTASGPFADFMSNMHKALDRWLSYKSQMSLFYHASADQMLRTLLEFQDAFEVVDKNAQVAIRMIPGPDYVTSVSTAESRASIIGAKLVFTRGGVRSEASIAELDFHAPRLSTNADGRASLWLYCREEPDRNPNFCIQRTMADGTEDEGLDLMSVGHFVIDCNSQTECEALLKGLRRSADSVR